MSLKSTINYSYHRDFYSLMMIAFGRSFSNRPHYKHVTEMYRQNKWCPTSINQNFTVDREIFASFIFTSSVVKSTVRLVECNLSVMYANLVVTIGFLSVILISNIRTSFVYYRFKQYFL